MKVPIHVLPVGDENVGGDVAIVSLVAPNQVRKFSRVAAQVYVRSFGYKGKRAELKIVAAGRPPASRSPCWRARRSSSRTAWLSYSLVFDFGRPGPPDRGRIEPATGRGVGVEQRLRCRHGHRPHQDPRALPGRGERAIRRAAGYLRNLRRHNEPRGALLTAPASADGGPGHGVHGGDGRWSGGDFSTLVRTNEQWRGFPETASELFAFDAIILSNVPRDSLSDQHLAWIEEWIGRRGGGLCMAGGPYSFATGRWNETSVGKMLPVELLPGARDWDEALTTVQPVTEGAIHPVWHLSSDEAQNRSRSKPCPIS